jgi:hypothetical protein
VACGDSHANLVHIRICLQFWVPLPVLWKSMQIKDDASGLSRGYFIVSTNLVESSNEKDILAATFGSECSRNHDHNHTHNHDHQRNDGHSHDDHSHS